MRWELETPLTSGIIVLGVRVLDHLIGTHGGTMHGTIFALDRFPKRLGPAPAEEKKGAEEERTDGRNDNANYSSGAEPMWRSIRRSRRRRGRRLC
jgi:hypothetical protein